MKFDNSKTAKVCLINIFFKLNIYIWKYLNNIKISLNYIVIIISSSLFFHFLKTKLPLSININQCLYLYLCMSDIYSLLFKTYDKLILRPFNISMLGTKTTNKTRIFTSTCISTGVIHCKPSNTWRIFLFPVLVTKSRSNIQQYITSEYNTLFSRIKRISVLLTPYFFKYSTIWVLKFWWNWNVTMF